MFKVAHYRILKSARWRYGLPSGLAGRERLDQRVFSARRPKFSRRFLAVVMLPYSMCS